MSYNEEPLEITSAEEYSYRYENRTQEELDLAKKHSCSGLCYGNKFMCPRVDYCDETRVGEGIATILAVIVMLIIYLFPIAIIFYSIFNQ